VFRVYSLATTQKNLEELTPEERQRVLDELIGVTLLVDEAAKAGLSTSRTMAAQVELQRLQLVARAMATSHLEKNPATAAELQQIYDENLPRLAGEQYKARHILVETEAAAVGVIEQLRQGKDFVALAQEHSGGPTGPNGGDLGWFTAESMVQPIGAAVRAMQIGTYSGTPVRTDFGFHVILLEDKRAQTAPSLEDVRDDLVTAVQRKRLEDYLKTLKESANIVVGQ
jgi:peptidyl-prolyl cis-trans isomerase C